MDSSAAVFPRQEDVGPACDTGESRHEASTVRNNKKPAGVGGLGTTTPDYQLTGAPAAADSASVTLGTAASC